MRKAFSRDEKNLFTTRGNMYRGISFPALIATKGVRDHQFSRHHQLDLVLLINTERCDGGGGEQQEGEKEGERC